MCVSRHRRLTLALLIPLPAADSPSHMQRHSNSWSPQQVDMPLVIAMLVEVATAMLYLHNGGFVHCDLKPENILLKVGAKWGGNGTRQLNRGQ